MVRVTSLSFSFIAAISTFTKRTLTSDFDDLIQFTPEYMELRQTFLVGHILSSGLTALKGHVKELCAIIKRYHQRHDQASQFFQISLAQDSVVIAGRIHDWMKNGPWKKQDLEDLIGFDVSSVLSESIALFASTTKEILNIIDQDEPNLALFIDRIACVHIYLSVFVVPAVPLYLEPEFKPKYEALRGIMVQLIVSMLREDKEKKSKLKVDFGNIFRSISLIVKEIILQQHK